MKSRNLNDASQECDENKSCHMFFDYCGKGRDFDFCTGASREITDNSCGSILHIKEHQGNQNVILMSQNGQKLSSSRKANYYLTLSVFFQPDSGIACTEGHVCTHTKRDPFHDVDQDMLQRKCLKDAECKAIQYEHFFGVGSLCTSNSTKPWKDESRNIFHVVTYSWKACVIKGTRFSTLFHFSN